MIFHLLTEKTLKEKKFKAGMTVMERCAVWHSELSAVKGSSLPNTVAKFFSGGVVASYCEGNSRCFLYLKFLNFSSSIT